MLRLPLHPQPAPHTVLSPPARYLSVFRTLTAGILLCTLGAGCTSHGQQSPRRPASARPLTALVLQADEAPFGSRLVTKASGPRTLDKLLEGDKDAAQEKSTLSAAGFRGAYLAAFTGLELPMSAQQAHLVTSSVLVFPSDTAASSALQLTTTPLAAAGRTSKRLTAPGLGNEAVGFRLELPSFPGGEFVFAWRQTNTVRILIDAGATGIPTAEEALGLAQHIATAGGSRRASLADAPTLTLPPTEAPTGTSLAASTSGPTSLQQVARTPARAGDLRKLGFLGGYARTYLTPGLEHPVAPSKTTQTQNDYLISQVQEYSTSAHAAVAFRLFRDRQRALLPANSSVLKTPGLGSDAAGYHYVDHRPTGDLTGYAYYWRSGSYLLTLFDVGSNAFATEPTAYGLSLRMQKHAAGG